jgi:GDPmannose 4,6-dehydratase
VDGNKTIFLKIKRSMKKVLITGITGQDGSLMADYLLNNFQDIEVYGSHRRLSVPNHENIKHLKSNSRFKIVEMDITDPESINNTFAEILPDYFINFAANSFVGNSWKMPINHMQTNAMAVLYCLEAIKNIKPDTKFYNAGSSEQFGDVDYAPQDIKHPFKPRSPYGVSKCTAHHLVKVYRESYNLYAVQGILFNHEGVRRGEEFVTRKITKNVARILKSLIAHDQKFEPLELGNIYSKRDWSDAQDFVKGIWLMLNQDKPKDFVLSSNETHTIKEFIQIAFNHAKIKGEWRGSGIDERFLFRNYNDEFIYHADDCVLMKINEKFYRPAEVELLLGCSKEAREELNWHPQVSFQQLVEKMVDNDIKEYRLQ